MSNRSAFLWVLRCCEGTAGPNGYRMHFGGGLFDSYADHPRRVISASGYSSTAAGAYQILAGTWDDYCRANGKHDFSPASQDACAVWLIARRGALADVDAGRIPEAIAKCGKEWASLPGSPYGQPTRTYEYCLTKYRDAGGVVAGDPMTKPARPVNADKSEIEWLSAQQEPKTMGGLAAMLVQTLIGAFAPLAQEKINAALAKRGVGSEVGAQLVGTILNAVQPGLADADPAAQVAAVAAAQKDTAVVAKAEAAALDLLQTLAPLMDKSVGYDAALWAAEVAGKDAAAARARNERWDMTPTVVYFAAATLTGLVFALLGALLYQAVSGTHTIDSGLLGLAGPIFMAAVAAWGAIIAYRFDGTKDSSEQTRAMLRVAEGNSNASVR